MTALVSLLMMSLSMTSPQSKGSPHTFEEFLATSPHLSDPQLLSRHYSLSRVHSSDARNRYGNPRHLINVFNILKTVGTIRVETCVHGARSVTLDGVFTRQVMRIVSVSQVVWHRRRAEAWDRGY